MTSQQLTFMFTILQNWIIFSNKLCCRYFFFNLWPNDYGHLLGISKLSYLNVFNAIVEKSCFLKELSFIGILDAGRSFTLVIPINTQKYQLCWGGGVGQDLHIMVLIGYLSIIGPHCFTCCLVIFSFVIISILYLSFIFQ